jgi:hypothetical protein
LESTPFPSLLFPSLLFPSPLLPRAFPFLSFPFGWVWLGLIKLGARHRQGSGINIPAPCVFPAVAGPFPPTHACDPAPPLSLLQASTQPIICFSSGFRCFRHRSSLFVVCLGFGRDDSFTHSLTHSHSHSVVCESLAHCFV